MPKVKKPLSVQGEMTAMDIKKSYGGTLSIQGVMSYLGMSRRATEKFLKDVDAIVVNGRKRYMATDLARKIESCRVPGGV